MLLGKLSGQWQYLRSQPGYQKAPFRAIWRLLYWRYRTLTGRPVTIRLREQKLSLYLPPEWHGASKLIYVFRDDYEPDLELLKRFLVNGSVMLDVGANYGIFSLNASRLAGPAGKIIAFEPAQASFAVLAKNIELNSASNVLPLRHALADKPGKLRLFHDPDPTRNSLAPGNPSQDYEEVQVATVDHFSQKLKLERLDFMKIDVEGADELVCRGASDTFRTWLPPVLFEYNTPAAGRMGLQGNGSSAVLAEHGYEFYSFHNQRLRKVQLTDLRDGNILAMHPKNRKIESA